MGVKCYYEVLVYFIYLEIYRGRGEVHASDTCQYNIGYTMYI